MSDLAQRLTDWHQPLNQRWLRGLSLLLALLHAGLVMWEPYRYAHAIGGFNATIVVLMIWAMCTSVIFGIGFQPINWCWQILFSPYFSLVIMGYLTYLYCR